MSTLKCNQTDFMSKKKKEIVNAAKKEPNQSKLASDMTCAVHNYTAAVYCFVRSFIIDAVQHIKDTATNLQTLATMPLSILQYTTEIEESSTVSGINF